LTSAQTIVNIRPAVASSEETVGQRIRRLRKQLGLTQRDISGPGLSFAYISRLEAGRRSPSPKALGVLALRLGVPPGYLATGSRVPGHLLRERRLADAELELRLGRDVERAEGVFRSEADSTSGLVHDEVLTARAHAGLGLLAGRRSSWRDAVRHLEAATGSGYLDPVARPDLYEALGAAYTAFGAPGKAVELFERCAAEVRELAPGDTALAVRFLTHVALAASSAGDPERVRDALAQATGRAGEAELPQAWIALYWALAISEWNEERSRSARTYAERTIALLESTEDTVQLARARIFLAQLLTLDEDFDRAEPHLASAAESLGSAPDATDLGLLRAEQAKVSAAQGDPDGALAQAVEAERLLGDDVRYGGKRWHALAAARAASGDAAGASAAYATALRVLEERRQWREAAQVAREAARFALATRREDEAWELLERVAVLRAAGPRRLAHAG
jgi:transcriptional regulator with XRE-family HTH domain